jgi:nucleoside-diphosphate-sugar epimerase
MVDLEVLPLKLLGRPRVDVTLRISGLFRDAFPQLVGWFNRACALVAALDEPEDTNPLAAAAQREGQAWRVYGSAPGAYGAGLQALIDSGQWESRSDLGEAFLRSYHKEYGLEYTVFRFFNTYGPKQSKDFVVSKFIRAALHGEDITIYGDGSQTRTFCYIDDNIDACLNAFRNNEVLNDVVNIGSDVEISILELAKMVIALTGSASKVVHLPPLEEGDMTRRMPDVKGMRQLLGREPKPLKQGLELILANSGHLLS